MLHHYNDIRSRIAEPPKWWDENGVPRYVEFSPREVADIYSDEAALYVIQCQNCGHEFTVAASWSRFQSFANDGRTLASMIRDGSLHYGDPPNVECCPSGPTMNCEDLYVLEYWKNESFDWVRDATLEIPLDGAASSLSLGQTENRPC